MNRFLAIIKNDFRNYIRYNILQAIIIISLMFSAAMAFLTRIDALIFIYITAFILPVVIFAINFYIEKEERTLIPLVANESPSLVLMLGKLVSALILLLIPFVLYVLVMYLVLHMSYNIILFLLVYVLAVIIHVLIGIVLAIIAKSNSFMSLSYLAYIVIFSLIPIFYTNGLIPDSFRYVMVISPAYLSGILFQEIYHGYLYSEVWLIVLSVVLQLFYIGIFAYFIIRPYFKSYLILSLTEGDKHSK